MKVDQQNLNFRKTKLIRQYLSMGTRMLFSGVGSSKRSRGVSCDVIDLTKTDDLESVLKSKDFAERKVRPHRLVIPTGNENFRAELNAILAHKLLSASMQSLSFEIGSYIALIKGKPGFTQNLSGFLRFLQSKFPEAEFLVILDGSNCYWADDILLVFEELGIKRFFFTISAAFLNSANDEKNLQKSAFHILMFFESLQRHPGIGYAESKVYKRLAGIVRSKFLSIIQKADSVTPGFTEDACVFLAPDLLIRITPAEIIRESKKLLAGKLRSDKAGPLISASPEHSSQPRNPNPKSWKKVLITGWYGTETQGDKAILGELLYFIKQCSPQCEILLTTIHQIISEQTNTELEDLKNAKLINIKEASDFTVINAVDAVIMGGGPLTDSTSMREIWKIFSEANRQEKARVIFGCGIGPLHLQEYTDWTRKILELTSSGFLRDMESKEKADQLCPSNPLNVACDPAIAFVNRWKKRQGINVDQKTDSIRVGTLLRAMTGEFFKGMSQSEIDAYNKTVGKNLTECLAALPYKINLDLQLLHMNAPWIGGDDRIFNRFIEYSVENRFSSENIKEYLTLNEHLEKMDILRFSLAMRYHGHIFSLALGIPFFSIDYTGKQGKVSNLLKRIGYEDFTLKLENINQKEFLQKWETLLEREEEIKAALNRSARILISELYEVYRRTFDIELYPEQENIDR